MELGFGEGADKHAPCAVFLLFLLLRPDISRHGHLSRTLFVAFALFPARTTGHTLGAPAASVTNAADCRWCAPADY